MERTVLVTGAAGSVGEHVVRALRSAGWSVRCLVHRRQVEAADETVRGDLADAASLAPTCAGTSAVLHLAALTHARRERDYLEANVEGTRRLLDAASMAGVSRFVHVSTRAIGEDGGAYSRSKRSAESVVAESGVPFVVVRFPEVYGTGSAEGVDAIIDRARRGAAIPLVGDGSDEVRPVHIDDAVAALAAAVDAPQADGRTYTLAGDRMTVREFSRACGVAFGTSSRLVRVPVAAVRVAGAVARVAPLPLVPDQLARLRAAKPDASRDAADDLGFAPRPLTEGLQRLASASVAAS